MENAEVAWVDLLAIVLAPRFIQIVSIYLIIMFLLKIRTKAIAVIVQYDYENSHPPNSVQIGHGGIKF
jgi:hypothetical protein